MQNENPDIDPSLEEPIPIENKGQEELLSPLKPQQLQFGSTSGTSQAQTIQNPLTTVVLPTPPLPPPVLPIMMVNVPVAPRITNIVHIPYFLGRP